MHKHLKQTHSETVCDDQGNGQEDAACSGRLDNAGKLSGGSATYHGLEINFV